MHKSITKHFMSLLVLLFGFFSLIACGYDTTTVDSSNPDGTNSATTQIHDSFLEINLIPIEVEQINFDFFVLNEIVTHSIHITSVDVIDIELTTINDEFIYLVYQNYQDYYGVSIDWEEFLKDLAIGTAITVAVITVSVLLPGAGTSIVIAGFTVCESVLSTVAIGLAVGAAVDAGISAFIAYLEGGDTEYILGQALQGTADGLKWGALFAPLEIGVSAGARALKVYRATNKLAEMGLKYSFSQVDEILKNADTLVSAANKIARNTSDAAFDVAFDNFAKLNPTLGYSKELLKQLVKDPLTLISLLNKFDVYKALVNNSNVKRAVLKELGDSVDDIIKKIPTVTSIDDLGEAAARIIRANPADFAIAFAKNLKKEVIEQLIKEMIGFQYADEIIAGIKRLASNKNIYAELVKTLSVESKQALDQAIYSYNAKFVNGGLQYQAFASLMNRRFSASISQNLIDGYQLYNKIVANSTNALLTPQVVATLCDSLIKGTYQSLDEISNIADIGQTVAQNIAKNADVIIPTLQRMSSTSGKIFIDDLVATQLRRMIPNNPILTVTHIREIVKKGLSKSQIIANFGEEVYQELQTHTFNVITNLTHQSVKNSSLIKSLVKDFAISNGLTDDAIETILKSGSFKVVDISEEVALKLGSVVQQYFKSVDPSMFDNFTREWSLLRGKAMFEFYESNGLNILKNDITYASLIEKFGVIEYNDFGFPIFDKFSVAYLEIPNLTGISDIDIAMANMIHHGTTQNIYGFTWHHLEDGKGMILIPTELNSAYKHTGGAAYLRYIHAGT